MLEHIIFCCPTAFDFHSIQMNFWWWLALYWKALGKKCVVLGSSGLTVYRHDQSLLKTMQITYNLKRKEKFERKTAVGGIEVPPIILLDMIMKTTTLTTKPLTHEIREEII